MTDYTGAFARNAQLYSQDNWKKPWQAHVQEYWGRYGPHMMIMLCASCADTIFRSSADSGRPSRACISSPVSSRILSTMLSSVLFSQLDRMTIGVLTPLSDCPRAHCTPPPRTACIHSGGTAPTAVCEHPSPLPCASCMHAMFSRMYRLLPQCRRAPTQLEVYQLRHCKANQRLNRV